MHDPNNYLLCWKEFLDVDELWLQSVDQKFQGFLAASSVCNGFGTPTSWQGDELVQSRLNQRNICKIQKSELCHLERGEGGKVSSGFWRKSPSVWGGDLPARQV